jgi:hypothetical protein
VSARPFLITGLPRSRTAWLSVLATTGKSMCYHHPTFSKIEDLAPYYDHDSLDYVGVSYSMMGFFLPWILENIKPRTLIVMRNIDDVRASMDKIGLNTEAVDVLRDTLIQYMKHPLVYVIPFPALDDTRVMSKAFAHLMPGMPFDETRFKQLCQLNIQMDVPKAIRFFREKRPEVLSLLKTIFPRVEVDDEVLEALS